MVQRKASDIIVPVGDTLLLEDDKIIMIKTEDTLGFPKPYETNKEQNINVLEKTGKYDEDKKS